MKLLERKRSSAYTIDGLLGLCVIAASASACKDRESPQQRPTREAVDASEAPVTRSRESTGSESVEGPPVRKDGTIFADTEMMGTRVSINLYIDEGRHARDAQRAVEAAFEEMARIEDLLSEWRPHSELSRFNRAAGGPPIAVSPELADVLVRSRRISEETDGRFDVTFHGVGQLWSFQPGAVPPAREQIEAKLPLVDWRGIEVDTEAGTARLAREGMMVGLGAIGKGYAVERASTVLDARGFANHVVEAGGDTYASGTKGGQPWMVGVQHPDANGVLGALPASDRAIVTSGDYQRYFEHEGSRYAHIIDPRTGWPIELEHSPKSVTLVADNPTDADAYCTAVVIMGAEDGLRFVQSRDDLEALIVTRSDEIVMSSGLEGVFIRTTPQGAPLPGSAP